MNSVPSKGSSLPDKGALLGHQAGDVPADQLVRHWFPTVLVQAILVDNVPSSGRVTIVVSCGLASGGEPSGSITVAKSLDATSASLG